MVLDHSNNTNASGSTFNQVGGNQTNLNKAVVHLHFSLFSLGSRGSSANDQDPSKSNRLQVVNSKIPLQTATGNLEVLSELEPRCNRVTHSPSPNPIQSSIALIVQIVKLLLDSEHGSDGCRDLRLELKILYENLNLSSFAIQEYKNRALGPSLVKFVNTQAQKCHAVLRELLDKVDDTRFGFNLRDIWRPIWSSRWYGSEFTPLKAELCAIRRSLAGALVALNLCVFHF
jgi:hypothetical protein